jgi:UDP-GlcNAc:undecaprenyl-phosphate/decaprenyl-phosphate GlcNAc-1-phosphate transferase
MNQLLLIICLVVGFLISWGSIPLIRRIVSRRNGPNRTGDFHHGPKTEVPRLGGVALVAAFIVVGTIILAFVPEGLMNTRTCGIIMISSLAMFGLGFWDDLRPLGARVKLVCQILIAAGVYFAGIQIEVFKNPFNNAEYQLGLIGLVATVFWLVALTNLINLIDGIDGLAGGIAFMLMCLLASVGLGIESSFSMLLSVGMAGALLGFLYYNFPPAKIYMGDGGAYFLGFLIGILSIANSHKGSVAAALIAPVFALALPIVDVMLAILRRGFKGLPIFRPDKKHIHHRLIAFGLSRERTVLILYVISFLCLFLAFAVFWSQGRLLPLLFGFLFLILAIAARSFGFIKEWLSAGSRLGRSMALRKETRYALTLGQWLEMEAERRDSVYELWQDFQFLVKKLGFSEVKLVLADRSNIWRAGGFDTGLTNLRRTRHEMSSGSVIEFAADETLLSEKLFELMAELAAETWHKAALRWQEVHQVPMQFVSVASPETSFLTRKMRAISAPGLAKWWARQRGLSLPAA